MKLAVPAQVYDFPAEDIDFITGELRSMLEGGRYLTGGEVSARFEEAFSRQHGDLMASAVNSGTAALEAILTSVDVRGGEVIVPTNTFGATGFAVVRAGARPVFADVLPDFTVDPADVARRITDRTKAVVTVHIGGLISPATLELVELCRDRGIALVEDAAHAHGSTLHGRPAGSFGVAAAFSFYATKVMTTGEGGMVLTSDERVHRTVRMLRNQAKVDGNRHEAIGANWRMSEVSAMFGLAQTARLPDFVARRREIAERYRQKLSGVPGITVLPEADGARSCYYKVIAVLDGVEPAVLREELHDRYDVTLGGAVYDLPMHQQPVFRQYADGPLPVAEDLCQRHICPPVYPSLTEAQLDHVVTALTERVNFHLATG
ncbi:DegT/DnrJ/EryC1/StrS family aminotransferase [Micromonospora sp. DT229]|uniref:DegT/DnrJ/EryC1/StrS family aminotransferase n=1 Tax=Micromonospora sp. DT229 TaxID=3393430 RepID=UPI003CF66398